MAEKVFLGLDIGSTTVKLALVLADGQLLEARYVRHGAAVRQTLSSMLSRLAQDFPTLRVQAAITGSASLELAGATGLPFVQEVMAAAGAIRFFAPQTDVAVELGGEDAKILYFEQGLDLRMNEACAGGTGAFIDQMASLLDTDAAGLNTLAAGHTTLYPIASRCGVFAKTDIVPLLNEGAAREDLAASIFQAVVEQTISGLACGHPIRGKVAFLGGPLHFLPELRTQFISTLGLKAQDVVPIPNAQYMVALGTALSLAHPSPAQRRAHTEDSALFSLAELATRIGDNIRHTPDTVSTLPPLFADEAEYSRFCQRHARDTAPAKSLAAAEGPVYVGIDLGSTTVKAVLVDDTGAVLASWYEHNQGDPLAGLIPCLIRLLEALPPTARLRASATTGYGAELARAALGADFSEVETVAHLKAACRLAPDATYVIDIGGQDMKCLKAEDGVIAGVTLNEACSAGCGAFLETFARSLHLSMEAFVHAALYARHPVDLGSRCTVFMNSKVKQAQKEGAAVGDIAAGLCYAVARNALYKVLRLRSPADLGSRVLVQGGAFANDALLRVMERLLERDVFRPTISGLMGAYGAALIARERSEENVALEPFQNENTLAAQMRRPPQRDVFPQNDALKHGVFQKQHALERFQNEKALLTRKWQPPQRGVDSDKNYVFCQNDALKHGVFQKQHALEGGLCLDALRTLRITTRTTRCKGCGNRCLLTINAFSNGRRLVTGNRCERGEAIGRPQEQRREACASACPEQSSSWIPNLYAWKAQRLFAYEPLAVENAHRGRLGIPRVLNLYEHYPFWFTLFTRLGYRVELSPPSGKAVYALGLESMPSQSVCYPAKLAHGHVVALINAGLKHIFFPCLPRETRESLWAEDCYNCPVVCSYPEVVRLNTDALREQACTLHSPFVQPAHPRSLIKTLHTTFGLPIVELKAAVAAAKQEQAAYRAALRAEGEKALAHLETTGGLGIVLGGRPYHADPAVNHGLPELIAALGAAVLSEDSVAHLGPFATRTKKQPSPLRVIDQWTFHSRLYRAAALVCSRPNLELVQLTSFGCGLDAVTTDQVCELLHKAGKLHTLIKIDEGASLGAARIRIRSLFAAVRERRAAQHDALQHSVFQKQNTLERTLHADKAHPVFTKALRQTHTILAPQMAPLHFDILSSAFNSAGYRLEVLPHVSHADIEAGLNVVHNDACYPAIVVIGQLLRALQSGRCDPAKSALLLAQTCGPCRATNYPALLRKALIETGFDAVPVVTVSGGKVEEQPGFSVSPRLLHRLILGCLYGDMLQRVSLSCRVAELHAGDTDDLLAYWMNRARHAVEHGDSAVFRDHMTGIVRDFSAIRRDHSPRPRVGVVGEILLKYHPDANNHVLDLIREEGGEPVLTDLTDFFLYCLMDPLFEWRYLGGSGVLALSNWLFIQRIEHLRNAMRQALAGHTAFLPVSQIAELGTSVRGLVSTGNRAGEGWLLTADMLELIDHGMNNVLCLQPFGCLPNHITGKGTIKELKRVRPQANIMAVDYDPGSSETNQVNRIKLFMSVAHARLEESLRTSTTHRAVAACSPTPPDPRAPCPTPRAPENRADDWLDEWVSERSNDSPLCE